MAQDFLKFAEASQIIYSHKNKNPWHTDDQAVLNLQTEVAATTTVMMMTTILKMSMMTMIMTVKMMIMMRMKIMRVNMEVITMMIRIMAHPGVAEADSAAGLRTEIVRAIQEAAVQEVDEVTVAQGV